VRSGADYILARRVRPQSTRGGPAMNRGIIGTIIGVLVVIILVIVILQLT
jgi:tetrahydromethanopterin S-methyltransferase subunit F